MSVSISNSQSPRLHSIHAIKNLAVKVPAVTAFFWIIKVLATTVGETFADFLTTFFHRDMHILTRHASLFVCAISFGCLLLILALQFVMKAYVPWVYWTAIVFISIAGTQITDTLHDIYGVELWVTTALFTTLLVATFFLWYRSEKTLAMKSINTKKREIFYWFAVLFTFALGTSAGDQLSEVMSNGFIIPLVVFAAFIAFVIVLRQFSVISAITAFWIAYVLTRPLGANLGDLLSQAPPDGGLGLGTNVVSLVFLALIIVAVSVLAITKRDKLPV